MKQYSTGMLEQAADPRDYSVRLVGAMRFPESAIKECDVPNSNQQVGKCVMCPLEAAFSEYYGTRIGGNWGYGYFRTHTMAGLYPREAYSMASDYGLPLKENDIAEEEVQDVIDSASTYAPRILPLAAERAGWTYAKLHTVEEVKAAIVQSLKVKGMRIAFATNVNSFGFLKPNNWLQYTEGGNGHMMMILGYGPHVRSGMASQTIEGVKVRNSWGEDWGDHGNCWMEWEDVLRRDEVYLLVPPAKPEEPDDPQIVVQRTLRLKDKPRMSGDDVRELQTLLDERGFPCGEIDGIFGPATDKAVRAFQRGYGLDADGIVGPKTWEALRTGAPIDREQLAEDMTTWLRMMVGWRYIIGAQGHELTRDYLDRQYASHKAYFTDGRYEWVRAEIDRAASLGCKLYAVDCSGLLMLVNSMMGFLPVRDATADGIWSRYCTEIGEDDVRPGDILFHETGGKMTHMAVVGTDGVYEAAGTAYGVVFRPWSDMYSRRTFNRMTGRFDTLKPWTHYGRLEVVK